MTWSRARGGLVGESGDGVRNEMGGSARNVVQVGAVYGDVRFGASGEGASAEAPQQVPVRVGHFVNREAELEFAGSLVDRAGGGRPVIVAVHGTPGVGKSSFLLRVAERLGAFPGGQLYADFRETTSGPVTGVNDVLAAFLRALHVEPEVIPAGLGERAGLFRTKTSAKPVLVVLDEVTDAAQVLPFVPKAPGSAVLVAGTSQLSDLFDEGAELVPLEPLDAAHSAKLVAELSRRDLSGDQEAVSDLVRLCGGLPVALTVVAAKLRTHPGLSVTALHEEISAHGLAAFRAAGRDKVSAVFSVAYADLPADVARLYRLLSVLPGPDFSAEMAAVTADISVREAKELLEHLVLQAGLLTEDTHGRFHLHALVARYARERASVEEQAAELEKALHRTARWLLVRAAWADLTMLGPGRFRCTGHDALLTTENPFAGAEKVALAWLDAERANLVAMMRAAAEHRWHDIAWQLAEAASALYLTCRYLVDWAESAELGGREARLAGNAGAEARLRSFGTRASNDLDKIATELAESLALAQETGEARLIASIWELYGRYHHRRADWPNAFGAYEKAIELFTGEHDERGVAFVMYFLGCSQRAAGQPEVALETLERALPLIRAVPNARMAGRALTELGRVRVDLGEPAAAVETLREAITVLEAGGYKFYEAGAHEMLATVSDDRDVARRSLTRAVDLLGELGSPRVAEVAERLREFSE
ncbi:tetratricopeptide repeat protein [Amycolatopsis sp. NPDC058986]|uniref:tetratricopeptide repeat protein n=1 Tax=unclassified Amycolatopsis TaxID=2618356 RepID=UPI00366ABFBD